MTSSPPIRLFFPRPRTVANSAENRASAMTIKCSFPRVSSPCGMKIGAASDITWSDFTNSFKPSAWCAKRNVCRSPCASSRMRVRSRAVRVVAKATTRPPARSDYSRGLRLRNNDEAGGRSSRRIAPVQVGDHAASEERQIVNAC